MYIEGMTKYGEDILKVIISFHCEWPAIYFWVYNFLNMF